MNDDTEVEPGNTFGWRDQPGGQELWHLILEAFAKDARS